MTYQPDNFQFDELNHFAMPCCACVHRHWSDQDEPCRTCCHNSNAVAVEGNAEGKPTPD